MPLLSTRRARFRGWLGMFTIMVTLGQIGPAPVGAAERTGPDLLITSTRYIVIDAETGEVFASRGAHEQAAMASLTKIFTAIEGIEAAEPDQIMTTKNADIPGPAATTMGFGPDEQFTFQDLLYGMMLPSGNDAARAIARNVGYQPGDTDQQAVARFVARMNTRLKDMGLTDTRLVNPDGWGVPGHYTSVHDLAAFTMYALQYPRFVDAISTQAYETGNGYYVTNTNRMLNTYDGILGGKTGYDDDAGYCLIEVARRDGSTMISVTLNGVAPGDWYDDNRVLLNYAFEQKAARTAGNARQPVGAMVVSYLDPDAAFIAKHAQGGASLGVPALAAAPSDPSLTVDPLPAPALDPGLSAEAGRGRGAQWLAAVGVAGLLILARSFGTFQRPGPRPAQATAAPIGRWSRLAVPRSWIRRRRSPAPLADDSV